MASLPDNLEQLKQNDLLRERIRLLYAKLFGKKSEKYVADGQNPQLPLFDMPEPTEIEPEEEAVEIGAHQRHKRGRKPLPEDLPRVDVIHDIDENEKVCGCGTHLSKIGEDVSEKLDIIPAVIRVIRHIRPKYACRQCEGLETKGATVKIAPPPKQIIPKGIASAGLLAHILTAKFCDALSLLPPGEAVYPSWSGGKPSKHVQLGDACSRGLPTGVGIAASGDPIRSFAQYG